MTDVIINLGEKSKTDEIVEKMNNTTESVVLDLTEEDRNILITLLGIEHRFPCPEDLNRDEVIDIIEPYIKELKIKSVTKLGLMLDADQINNLYNKRNMIN